MDPLPLAMAKDRIREQIEQAEHARLVRSVRPARRYRMRRPRWLHPALLALRVISAPARPGPVPLPSPSPAKD